MRKILFLSSVAFALAIVAWGFSSGVLSPGPPGEAVVHELISESESCITLSNNLIGPLNPLPEDRERAEAYLAYEETALARMAYLGC